MKCKVENIMMKVLVIEDEQLVRDTIIETLIYNGYNAQGAFNGQVGVKLAKQIRPDVVLCDVSMDGMDGYGVLEALRGDSVTATLPFIFLTARADRQSMRRGMELGADDFITKPYSSSELLGAITARLSRIGSITHEAENHLTQARQKLVEMVSERIQRPLESVSHALETVSRQLKQLPPADMQHLLDTASGDSRRISRIVDQMALYVRMDNGLLTAQHIAQEGKNLLLRDIWMQALERATTIVENRSDIEFEFDEHNPNVKVFGDSETLTHALMELIINALSNSPQCGIVTFSQWAEDKTVWFSVTDHGMGMSPRHVQAAMGEGNEPADGMGLKLVRGIIEAHGGKFALHSGPGEGTTAAVWVPKI